ncbi:aspartyl protease family protein [Psychroflexus sp. MES1-P1E]|uniref:aspartyl protease family protein n=1 Tax=Psychroflexus sp. MES1-P1E TaxID=2058320 RepID=UPI000C7D041B|nr:aspartyl protease family protein [Psychroflexus sp. MES1-P1E]PKG42937.1 signaling protein [Psychroflexus sp. MES1-P1E]
MKKNTWFWSLVFCSLFYHHYCFSQNQFKFKDEEVRAVNLKFNSVNNLIILSALLNGKPVNFLLDTGVNKTKVFGQVKDSLSLVEAEYISLRSLGSSEPVKAFRTTNNIIDFGPIRGEKQEVYFITDPRFDLSSKLGINVQGIIGYEFLKDFILRLNYNRNKLRLYQHDKFNRKLNDFDKINFRFIRKKPHIKIPVEFKDGTAKELVFLIDAGSSDAFWIFENKDVVAPKNSFFDYIGYGLETVIEGMRSKAKSVQLGGYKLKEPRTAYLDSVSAELFTVDRYKDGILGAEVLRRFVTFFDYKNQNLYLKSNRSFNDNFNYDRSGLFLQYTGEEINTIKTPIRVKIYDKEKSVYTTTNSAKQFSIRLQISKILNVANIRPNSPSSEIDIQIGDRILKMNGRLITSLGLDKINQLLSGDEGDRIKMILKRGDVILKRTIILRSQLN